MPESLPAELVDLQQRAEQFAVDALRPHQADLAAKRLDRAAVRAAVTRAAKSAGFFAMTQPKSAGGSARNMRPNRPLKNRELGASVSPRTPTPCGVGLATVVNLLPRARRCALLVRRSQPGCRCAALAHSPALPHVCH